MKNIKKLIGIIFITSLMSGCNTPSKGNTSNSNIENTDTQEANVSVTSVSLNVNQLQIYDDAVYTLVATVLPENATNKSVSWSSSNPNVASVSENGLVTALSVGETIISVTTEDGNKVATCNLKVVGLDENENTDVTDVNVPDDDLDGEFVITTDDITTINKEGNVYTLSPSVKSVYSLSGKLDGQIVIDSTVKVELDLNGVSISNSENSPIYVKQSDNIEIKSGAGTVNYINDNRATCVEEVEGQGKGAIYSESGNIAFTGKGTLAVVGNYYNGVHTKDNFSLKNTQLKITAVHNGVKANDAVSVESGSLDIDCGNDGLVTENTSVSSKGNQKGNVDITGGSVLINSVGDGIVAAYNCNISNNPAIEIKTDKYSSYSGPTASVEDEEMAKWHVSVPSSYYSTSYRYAAYINNEWFDFTYKERQSSNRTNNYIYEGQRPENAESFKLYRFSSSQSNSLDTYNAVTDAKAFSTYGNMISIRGVSGTTISLGNWSNYSAGGQGGPGGGPGGGYQEGNTDKAEQSAKGIKADNEIHIDGGTIAITAYDDGIHTNCDSVTFENGLTPTGNLYITGGNITVSASDDGIHSDTGLYISGGTILVSESYEGIEGNTIEISGGDTTVFAKDDGVNASSGKVTPTIKITGGRLDETVSPSGDTDGIDSNGSYTQSGGVVIARGPNSSMAAALDTDGAVSVSGGTLIVLGSIEKTPSLTNMTTTTGLSGHSIGDHTIAFGEELISYNNKYSYAKTTVYSSLGKGVIQ